ncbi:hypothetical protein E4U82_06230 [Lentibacillus salicampi]|uniref:Uncharacterized protein n=1 Tax=Lentibacillus salicampi TaxID=175306 RepID=A0A4Y9AFC0_9BACI|nr:hypothetical protein E4U82_06230 [Lentibacillus salicampi]
MIGAEGRRLLREKQQLKTPRKWFSSEEAEALPAESDCPQRKSSIVYVAVYGFGVNVNNFLEKKS